MRARRLRWHGPQRQTALADSLRSELWTWLEGWSVDPALLTLRVSGSGVPDAAAWGWTHATSRAGSVKFGAPEAVLDAFGGYLAGAAHADGLGLGRRIGGRALRALATQFAGGAGNLIEIHEASTPTAEDQEQRFGGCGLVLQGSGFEIRVFVDNDLFEYWVPPQRTILQPLSPRDDALGAECVDLDVVLDLGAAKLADAHQLRVGDVLVSNMSIDSVFHIALPDTRRLVTANLVRTGLRRALQIETTSPRKAT